MGSALAELKLSAITDGGTNGGKGTVVEKVIDWCNIIVVNSKHIRDILVSTFTRP
jgi:hypothetical protein